MKGRGAVAPFWGAKASRCNVVGPAAMASTLFIPQSMIDGSLFQIADLHLPEIDLGRLDLECDPPSGDRPGLRPASAGR